MIKEKLYQQILNILDKKIDAAKLAIEAAKESRDNETKCSVGDKYETGRTMMQLEVEKNRVQLNKTLNTKKELAQIDLKRKFEKVEYGSLVITSQGNYFISMGIGKLEVDNGHYYCISLASPVGKLLKGKKIGEKIQLQGREIAIAHIV